MLIAHLSDIHLGYSQFNLREREEDVYEVFEEAVNKCITEHADLILIAGDIFHSPRPSGSSIVKFANELKKVKEKSIRVFFVLGEHDINRTQDIPVPYLFHNLGLATKLTENFPVRVDNITIFGFDKERKSNIQNLLDRFKITQNLAKREKEERKGDTIGKTNSKNILVLHQGLTDFNKFAGEIKSTDLPLNFDYYAMGHYHDHLEKKPDFLDGLIAYPGSLDLTPSEGIKEVDKGFFITDFSANEVKPHWIRLENRRDQFSADLNYESLSTELTKIIQKANSCKKKPIIMLKILGHQIDSKNVASNLLELNKFCLHYAWQSVEKQQNTPFLYDGTQINIESELTRLTRQALRSEDLASFAITEVLPLAGADDEKATLDIVWKHYINSKIQNNIG